MSIHLQKPYKITQSKIKRYELHYQIPADRVLVVPIKELGTEAMCDVRWENDNGELKELHNVVFVNENLVPLNPLLDNKLYEIWEHYYGASV